MPDIRENFKENQKELCMCLLLERKQSLKDLQYSPYLDNNEMISSGEVIKIFENLKHMLLK